MATEIKILSLNSLPTDLDFEDFISAHLLLGGYVLDRSIHEKLIGAGEIFEVDIVTHQYKEKDEKRLVEIKSKKWDLSDIFKVGGRLRYFGMSSGAFIVQQKIDDSKYPSWQSSMKEKLEVSLLYVGKLTPSDKNLDISELYTDFEINKEQLDDSMIDTIRFSYIAERCMKVRFSQLKKSQKKDGFEELWDFSNAIQDISFYDEDPVKRLHRTFELFQQYNHLSARLDYELLHGTFPAADVVTKFEDGRVKGYMLNTNDNLPVNYSLYLEHRLRMYIVQSCVEYLVSPKVYQSEIDMFLKDLSFQSLSNNISNGIDYLSKCSHYKQYPLLWQLFTYLMGGFILTDFYDEEIALLSNLSKVPKDEVESCLNVYDVLFPTSDSWIREIHGTHIKRLIFMPAIFMGIGANFRRTRYRDSKDDQDPPYEELKSKLSSDYTYKNLLVWNKASFDVLKISDDLKKS